MARAETYICVYPLSRIPIFLNDDSCLYRRYSSFFISGHAIHKIRNMFWIRYREFKRNESLLQIFCVSFLILSRSERNNQYFLSILIWHPLKKYPVSLHNIRDFIYFYSESVNNNCFFPHYDIG